ncbi:ERF family protein [Comamonadaceae bacterium PP-2]
MTTDTQQRKVDLGPVAEQAAQPLTLHPAPAPSQSPISMMLSAMDRGASLEQIERMWELQKDYEANEAVKAYNVAFAEFKSEAIRIIKNRNVTDGPLRGKKYAELHTVVDVLTPLLSKRGLGASWKLTRDEPTWLEVTCTLRHIQGHAEHVSMGGPPDTGGAKNPIQARASTISYLERYTLKAITGVAEGGDDDDGNGGNNKPEVPLDLLANARASAMNGWKALGAFIESCTEEQRLALSSESYSLKKAAKEADRIGKERTAA